MLTLHELRGKPRTICPNKCPSPPRAGWPWAVTAAATTAPDLQGSGQWWSGPESRQVLRVMGVSVRCGAGSRREEETVLPMAETSLSTAPQPAPQMLTSFCKLRI